MAPPEPISVYATLADLSLYAISEDALRGIDPDKISAALEAASRLADSYLSSQYILPLVNNDRALTAAVSAIAAYTIVSTTGYNPESPRDDLYKLRNDQAVKWLEGVARGIGRPVGLAGSSADQLGGQAPGGRPQVVSSSPRGFSSRGFGPGGGFIGD